jgi:Tfp pilus assembly protein PilN
VRTVNVPDASKSDLLQALNLSIGQHVPIGPGDACIDLRILTDVGPDGRAATLVAMRAADLRTLYEEAKHAGIHVIATLPAAFGSWLLANGTAIPDCAAVSQGAEGVGVDLIQGGELRYSRALPPNSSNGQFSPELARTFSAAGLGSMPTFAAGMKVESATYNVDRSPLEALSGTGWTLPGVEFELPETIRARERAGQARKSRLAGVMCAAAVLLLGYGYMDWASAQSLVQADRTRMHRSLASLESTVSSRVAEAKAEETRLEVLQRGFEPKQRMADIVSAVSNALPQGAWLTNITVARGDHIQLRGTALPGENVTNYLKALNQLPRLRDVKLVFANNGLIESTPVVQFSITAFPVGNLPLVEKKSTTVKR